MGFLGNMFGNKTQSATPAVVPTARKVLIVEDEKMLADAMELKFKNAGFEVLRAENGQVGLDMTIANKPNIILLDLMMPIMNGKQMLAKVREIPEFKTLPVIVLSNAGDVDNMKETKFYYNANYFLIKSNVSMDDIVDHVKLVLG